MKLDIISGFLGSGKTTLIEKLMHELYYDEKILIIENEFGEIGIDATLLKSKGYTLKELNAGCICCNIQGDFEKSLADIVRNIKVDRIVLEPSGVANLSDVIFSCQKYIAIDRKIVVVDAMKYEMYLENFKSFFENQIQNANILIFSKVSDAMDKFKLIENIKLLNDNASIYVDDWKTCVFHDLKFEDRPIVFGVNNTKFYAKVFKLTTPISEEQFLKILKEIEERKYLRAKGIILLQNHYYKHFEYSSNIMKVENYDEIAQSCFVVIDDKKITYEI